MATIFPDGLRLSAHLGYLFTELPLEARFEAARDAGFVAVEHPAPYALPADHAARLLADSGLPYVQFGLPSGDASRGEKGIAIHAGRRSEFLDGLARALDYADALGVSMLHVMAGIVPADLDRERAWGAYLEHLSLAAEAAGATGRTILVEAMSPGAVPGYLVATPADAERALRACGAPNVKLLLDVFHTESVGDDPAATLERLSDKVAHVHIADLPGRHEPGTGRIDFQAVARALDGYGGHVGCEYVPAGRTGDGLAWMAAATRAGGLPDR